MKKITYALIIICAVFFTTAYPSVCQTYDKTVFWEITGNNLSQPSYIFGTIHFIASKDYLMTKRIKDKMKECKVFSTETLMNSHTRHILNRSAHLSENGSIEDLMSEEEYNQVKKFFVGELGVSNLHFDLTYRHLKPLVLSTTMTRLHLGSKVKFYETEMIKIAKRNNRELIGLETVEKEMEAMDHYPLEDQASALIQNVNNSQQHFDDFDALVDYWKEGDLEEILAITLRPSGDNYEFHRHFIDLRNFDWVPKMERKMDLAPTFFAVGAAHLGGDVGIIKLLKDKGYTMTPLSVE